MKKRLFLILAVYSLLWGQEAYQLKIIDANRPSESDSLYLTFILYKGYFSTVTDLHLHDLHLYINDQSVQLIKLKRQTTRLPVKMLFVLDNSGSMQANGRFIRAVSDLRKIIGLLPRNSLAGLIQVSDNIQYIKVGKMQDETLFEDLIHKGAKGNTPLFDGIYKALQSVQQQKLGIYSIIAFTDGLDKHSKYTAEDCLQLNETLRIPITIFLYNKENSSNFNNLIRLSDFSGGLFFPMETEILNHFPQIPSGTKYTVVAYCDPSTWEPKWQNLKLDIFYKEKILTTHTGIRIHTNQSKTSNEDMSQWLSLNTSYIVIGILILSFVLMIIWVLYFANKRAKTKKCPFCSKRYDIQLDNCPYCHQSTMSFYTSSNLEPELINDFSIGSEQNISKQKTENKQNDQQATVLYKDKIEIEDKTKLMVQESSTLAYLVIKKGSRVGLEYALHEGMNTIGRKAENSIVIEDRAISGFHSKIWQDENGNFIINDLATTNGTFVNDQKIVQRELKDKDEITIGQTVLTFLQIKQ